MHQAQQAASQEGAQTPPQSVIDYVPGAREVLETPEAVALVSQWRQCSGPEELRDAVSATRSAILGSEREESVSAADSGNFWIPFHYRAMPITAPLVVAALQVHIIDPYKVDTRFQAFMNVQIQQFG